VRHSTIIIAEADVMLRRQLCDLLRAEGAEVTEASDRRDVFRSRPAVVPDLVIIGSSRDGTGSSLEQAQHVREWRRGIPVILITPNSSEELAIAALRAGFRDYFAHPVPFDELRVSVRRCLADVGEPPRHDRLVPSAGEGQRMIGDGPRMREINAYIGGIAGGESNILITGETGTGKELAAGLIHRASRRRQKPFVCINCAAIPDSLLESELFGYEKGAFTGAHMASAGKLKLADGGTVLFDEIGDMSQYAQAKILRLIESKEIERLGGRRSIPIDVRVIAATNQDLEHLMVEGSFRKDLYFRLNVARIHLPPLRERKEDLPALLEYYVHEFNRELGREVDGPTDEALSALLRHDWPGNVRELRNLVEAVLTTLRSRHISLADLPAPYRRWPGDAPEAERDRLLAALLATRWNKSKTAERLHWSRMSVYRKIAKYQLVRSAPVTVERVVPSRPSTTNL
jgi:DNA-binding NtrC family response regulator